MAKDCSDATILVIEDDRVYRSIIQKSLSDIGHPVRVAKDGKEGMEMMREERPDIVLLDLIMPVMDGFKVLQAMRKEPKLKDIPVVILSVLGQEKDVSAAKEAGADDYIVKSTLSMKEAIERIHEHCPSES